MADISVLAGRGRIEESILQLTLPAGVDLAEMDAVIVDSATGTFVKADADNTARPYGMIHRPVKAGFPVTAIRIGVLDGLDLTTMGYGDAVYLSNNAGRVGTTAGTNTFIVGMVIPVTATDTGSAYDKLLMVDFR